ncbi:unnamed protein product [Didymodactylos carnosus]|uniref:ubiquitinyl hydrolase 1 n=1 Tax=Didymodactylos carnosus TaxID=1234261 RepID=A0A813Z0V1_9BILA|nr:unnamed protein product [Didymodactylos carnosus]CAF0892868.1 unnamed protein product [Didymodactylos carnosus]CAF3538595.1 unnamed protein product [Didymodactylos carnosus]CAF3676789.1 unnamed protein product [Didymodactylos carnosus]
MPSNPDLDTKREHYQKLIEKPLKEGDKYVLIDAKWFEYWKRFIGLIAPDSLSASKQQTDPPGPIDFTGLIDPSNISHDDGVQLRADAVEGNDYYMIPYELYTDLFSNFGKRGEEIVRSVICENDITNLIEIRPLLLYLCTNRHTANIKPVYRSRTTTLEKLKQEMMIQFSIKGFEYQFRLYMATDDFQWELLSENSKSKTLHELSVVTKSYISIESASMYQSSKASNSITSAIGTGQHPPGQCGLSNLGNTCFMNSAIQCISNVGELTSYFLNEEYKPHINVANPLGMKGEVATAYAELIKNMWSGKNSYYIPRMLKENVARYAPQFSGYSQQDSQEFICFLLDGLHEDLNLVKQKPYIEKTDDDGKKSDHDLAHEQWEYYRKRNQSKIHDIFHGQIKSQVQCLQCKTLGRTFDPICFLSLPLPNKKKFRIFKIEYVRLNGKIKYYHVKCNERGRMSNLIKDFVQKFISKKSITATIVDNEQKEDNILGDDDNLNENDDNDFLDDNDDHIPKLDHILPTEVYNHRIHLQYSDDALLANILERDQIVFYEVPVSLKKENNETILMPCILRTMDNMHQNFGLPFYLNIPRHKCQGKHILEALQQSIQVYLPLNTPLPSSSIVDSTKPPFIAHCVCSQSYTQTTKLLSNILDELIDFSRTNTTLICDVARHIVDQYEKDEQQRLDKERISAGGHNSSSTTSGMTTRSQQQKQSPITLLDCFKHFTTKETLSDHDQWYCPTCKELKDATKKFDLWLLPKVLIVQLKRFNYTRYFRDKIDLFIDCPIHELDLSQFVLNPDEKQNAKYDLIAVSNHMGGLGGGHYTAHAKNFLNQKWHTFDDSSVSSIDEQNVVTKSAYVLVYQQRHQNTNNDFYDVLPEVLSDIDAADYVAIDGEFTGILSFEKMNYFDTPAERYKRHYDCDKNYLMIQVGLAMIRCINPLENRYGMKAYNFYIFPENENDAVNFSSKSSSLQFLAANRFDFIQLFLKGIPFVCKSTCLEKLQKTPKHRYNNKTLSDGSSKVETSNDGINIQDSASASADNSTSSKSSEALLSKEMVGFSEVIWIIDSKTVASTSIFQGIISNTSLSSLYKCVREPPFQQCRFETPENFRYSTSEMEHTAGYDATMTGICIAKLLSFIAHKASFEDNPINHTLVQSFMGKLYFMRSFDLKYIDIVNDDEIPDRGGLFYVSHPKSWSNANVKAFFQKFEYLASDRYDSISHVVAISMKKQTISSIITKVKAVDQSLTIIPYAEFQNIDTSKQNVKQQLNPLFDFDTSRKQNKRSTADASFDIDAPISTTTEISNTQSTDNARRSQQLVSYADVPSPIEISDKTISSTKNDAKRKRLFDYDDELSW